MCSRHGTHSRQGKQIVRPSFNRFGSHVLIKWPHSANLRSTSHITNRNTNQGRRKTHRQQLGANRSILWACHLPERRVLGNHIPCFVSLGLRRSERYGVSTPET